MQLNTAVLLSFNASLISCYSRNEHETLKTLNMASFIQCERCSGKKQLCRAEYEITLSGHGRSIITN
jgi:hypothetical protein